RPRERARLRRRSQRRTARTPRCPRRGRTRVCSPCRDQSQAHDLVGNAFVPQTPAHGTGRPHQGATVTPPHSSGSTSRTDCVSSHRWPPRPSSTPERSPYSYVVGSPTTRAPKSRARANAASTSGTRTLRRWVTTPPGGDLIGANAGDDDRAVHADAQLSPVRIADANAFLEAEGGVEPGDGGPHIRIDQDRRDGRGWCRAIRQHAR